MRLLDIETSGIDEDDNPYIKLRGGYQFHSYFPNANEKKLYARSKKNLPANLTEECFRVALDIVQRFMRDTGQIDEEVLANFLGLSGVDISLSLEIKVRSTEDMPEEILRAIQENCRTLGFDNAEFE